MAQARAPSPGGFTAVHVWMIGFVFLWLTSTVLLVWLYTEQEDLKNTAKQLQGENQRLARGGDKSLPWYSQASEAGSSMVGLLEDARKQTAVIAVGEEAADVPSVRAKVESLFEQIRRDGLVPDAPAFESAQLLPAMVVLYDNFRGQHDLLVEAQKNAADAQQGQRDLTDRFEDMQADFAKATDELKNRTAELEKGRADYAAKRDREVSEFERRLEDLKQQHSRDIQTKNNQIEEAQQKFAEIQTRHEELQAKLGELQIKPGQLLTARKGDGQVVKAVPGEDVVYINLGRQQHLTPGLQFAVYPSGGIPADGRAKGRIEVTQIFDTTAACRILAVDRSEIVLENDIVANPVYDPNRPLRFVVVGEFDLDGDGHDDSQGAEQIKALIEQWGGQLADTISSRIDFVVAGFAPSTPETVGSAKATADRGAQERDRLLQRRRDEYDEVVASATNLSIPVLTQDEFLQFLGF